MEGLNGILIPDPKVAKSFLESSGQIDLLNTSSIPESTRHDLYRVVEDLDTETTPTSLLVKIGWIHAGTIGSDPCDAWSTSSTMTPGSSARKDIIPPRPTVSEFVGLQQHATTLQQHSTNSSSGAGGEHSSKGIRRNSKRGSMLVDKGSSQQEQCG
eukprot:PhF_6_TR9457/c0_g1_i1/m.14776